MYDKFKTITTSIQHKINKKLLLALGALLLIAGFALYLPNTVSVSNTVSGKELPINCVKTEKKQVALSFNVVSGNSYTQDILGILAKYNIKATFFVTGSWVDSYPDDVKTIAAAGHDLGNYSENYKNMSQLSNEDCQLELEQVHNKVKELTGIEMNLFRPPYSDYNNDVIAAARECGYYTIAGNVDSLDWKDYGADSIVRTVTKHENLENGSIIVMNNSAKYTKDALETIVTTLEREGYELVPVSELLYTKRYHLDDEGRQIGE